ncbi:MAG: flippase [Nitrospiraceae bacterium]|nr:flippase [Nitrospiraceae bacterium]
MFEIKNGTIAKNTALNLIGWAVPALVAIFSIPPLVRILGAERFGLLSLIWVTVGYAHMFSFGLSPAITKYCAEALCNGDRGAVRRVALAGLGAQAAIGVLAMIALMLVTPYLAGRILKIGGGLLGEAKSGFYIASFGFPAVLAANSFRSLLAAFQRFDLINLARVPLNITSALAPLAGALLGWSFPRIILALVLVLYLFAFLFFLFSARICPEILRGGERAGFDDVRRLAKFGGWVCLSGLLSSVFTNMDRFFVGALVSVSAVAYYTVPCEVLGRFAIIPGALTATLFPALSGLHVTGQGERINLIVARGLKALLFMAGMITVSVFLFGGDFLRLWMGAKYAAEGSAVFSIIAAGFLVNALAYIPNSLLMATGRPDIPARFHMIELPVYIAMLVVLTRLRGIEGTALCWALRALMDAVLLFAAVFRMHPARAGLRRGEGWARLAFHMSAFGAAALALCASGPAVSVKLLFFLGGSCLVALSFWKTLDMETRGSIAGVFGLMFARPGQ